MRPLIRQRKPTAREQAVAEILAECDCGAPGCHPGKQTAAQIAARAGLSPSNVANILVQIRRRMGPQAQ